jgi:hypothetical protein
MASVQYGAAGGYRFLSAKHIAASLTVTFQLVIQDHVRSSREIACRVLG